MLNTPIGIAQSITAVGSNGGKELRHRVKTQAEAEAKAEAAAQVEAR